MTAPERALLMHRLRELANAHDKAAEDDHYADTADTLLIAHHREFLIDAALLREAADVIAGGACG